MQERVVREIRTLRAMWRALETGSRQVLNGHEGGNPGHKPRMSLRATAPVLDPTSRSTQALCQGDRGAESTCLMPCTLSNRLSSDFKSVADLTTHQEYCLMPCVSKRLRWSCAQRSRMRTCRQRSRSCDSGGQARERLARVNLRPISYECFSIS